MLNLVWIWESVFRLEYGLLLPVSEVAQPYPYPANILYVIYEHSPNLLEPVWFYSSVSLVLDSVENLPDD